MDEILVAEDVQNIGPHYDRTLMAWSANLDASWGRLKEKYQEPFYRMWKLYLQGCAAGFRSDLLRERWPVQDSSRPAPRWKAQSAPGARPARSAEVPGLSRRLARSGSCE